MIHGSRSRSTPPRRHLSATASLTLWLLSAALPVLALFALLWFAPATPRAQLVALAAVSSVWLVVVALRVRAGLLRHIRTLSSLLEAARAHDYTIKAAYARGAGELAELYRQVNLLIGDLESGRSIEQESLAMLRIVVDHIAVAIVVCDPFDRIRLINRAAAKLLGATTDELVGTDLGTTAFADIALGSAPRVLDHRFPGAVSRWQMSQQMYRHQGKPSRIVFVADLRQVLADEEIQMWQRLIRVISHEVNNSLTPIMSLCQMLATIAARPELGGQVVQLREGLEVIGQRATGLKEFISRYARIARLPAPQKVLFRVSTLIDRVLSMYSLEFVESGRTPELQLYGDPVHLEQALINLVKNAIEANAGSDVPVRFSCSVHDGRCEFEIVDNGRGISNPDNLFVPFFTTKANGGGIGLALSRKIAAQHFGQVTLENRADARGAVARLSVPLPPPQRTS